jgi:hypothetical protein
MKLLYKPIGILFGLIASRLAKVVFGVIWARIDDQEPPEPTAPHATFPKVIAAKSIEAATMAGVGAASDRLAATVFHHLTGAWPGKDPEPAD